MTGDSMALPGVITKDVGQFIMTVKCILNTTGGSTIVTICTIATGVVTSKTDANFNVGSYSDGGSLVTNEGRRTFYCRARHILMTVSLES